MTQPVSPRAGCGAAIFRHERLLLVRRKRMPEADHWGLPGGKVDPFEKVADAVAREIHEELGLHITPRTLLCVVDQIDQTAGTHWIAPVFLVTEFEGEPTLREPDALSDMGWFALTDLPHPLTEATRQALTALSESRKV